MMLMDHTDAVWHGEGSPCFVDNNRTSWVVGAYLVLAEHVEAQEKVDSAVVFQHCER